MKSRRAHIKFKIVVVSGLWLACPEGLFAEGPLSQGSAPSAASVEDVVKALGDIPQSPLGESIRLGKELAENTHARLPKNAKARMNCTSCHLNSGTQPNAGSWVGVAARFPQYRDRSARVITLEDRINDCFARSLNGNPLAYDSEEMVALVAYMTWLSRGVRFGDEIKGSGMPRLSLSRAPDLGRGKQVYQSQCQTCHQAQGEGMYLSDLKKVVFPPLWGSHSFNIGAGMARQQTAAGFVKHNMPLGQGGSLSDDDAWDVAAYFIQMRRPDFKGKEKDWGKGGRPKDARY